MRLWLAALTCLFLPAMASISCRASGEQDDFIAAIRQLARLQDAAAQGEADSLDRQRRLLSDLTKRLSGRPVAVEPSRRGSDAMLIYVLSGGSPQLAEEFAGDARLTPRDSLLLNGAARFMRGDLAEARKYLDPLEAVDFGPAVMGRVALVKAMLLANGDAGKLELLAMAAAAMPGTLVEEAALRRAVYTAGEHGDVAAAMAFARRYSRRFGKSLFAPEFVSQLLGIVARREKGGPGTYLADLRTVLSALPPTQRQKSYFALIRLAIGAGDARLVLWAARSARMISPAMSPQQSRLDVYEFAYSGVLEPGAIPTGVQKSLRPAALSDDEKLLLLAAESVFRDIHRSPGTQVSAASDSMAGEFERDLQVKARPALEAADALLQDSR